MKNLILLSICLLSVNIYGQACLGNDTYLTAQVFDPLWISGCATGSSCSGAPTSFSNLLGCEPMTEMDTCPPAPSCGSETQGSDLWFMFYAMADTAVISVIQNTSFVASIQAFSGGIGCDSLTEIGCAIAGGPSSGVILNLSGLVIGNIYWFRVYGTSDNASQRSGIFCFCGSIGLGDLVLSSSLNYFNVHSQNDQARLHWQAEPITSTLYFDIEKSADGDSFESIGRMYAHDPSTGDYGYEFSDDRPYPGDNYYRLRMTDALGNIEYSPMKTLRFNSGTGFHIIQNPPSEMLRIYAQGAFTGEIVNVNGEMFGTWNLQPGENQIVETLSSGFYFFRNMNSGETERFAVMR